MVFLLMLVRKGIYNYVEIESDMKSNRTRKDVNLGPNLDKNSVWLLDLALFWYKTLEFWFE